MILEIGGRKIDFGDNNTFKVVFPLLCGEQQVLVSTTVEKIDDDDLLSSYSCGDMLNDIGQLMASTKCSEPSLHKITMDVHIQPKDRDFSEVSSCSAIACGQHTFTTMLQTLFISGIVSAYRMEALKRGKLEDENES
jgi:hypothetical protein